MLDESFDDRWVVSAVTSYYNKVAGGQWQLVP
jgi:hypothetical protein